MPRKPARLSDLADAPYNPRHITDVALAGLKRSVEAFGDLSGITWNSRTGHLVTGHQRVKALTKRYGPDLTIEGDWMETPDGERFRVRVVDWDETTEKAANVAANNHLIAGEFTDDVQGIIDELLDEIPELAEELRFEELEVDVFGGEEFGGSDVNLGSGEIKDKEQMERIIMIVPRSNIMHARKQARALAEQHGGVVIE